MGGGGGVLIPCITIETFAPLESRNGGEGFRGAFSDEKNVSVDRDGQPSRTPTLKLVY